MCPDTQYTEIIQLGVSAGQEGLSKEPLHTKVEEKRKTVSYVSRARKRFSILYAEAAYEGVKRSPTQTAGPMS
jgi:hypothetical protein